MKQILFILYILVCATSFAQKPSQNDIHGFNEFLGHDKAVAFTEAVISFDRFLLNNFTEETNESGRIISFLIKLNLENGGDTTWKYDTKENIRIIKDWDASGLRKELWIYGYEMAELNLEIIEEEIIPNSVEVAEGLDSVEADRYEREMEELYLNSQHRNTRGAFIHGLETYAANDPYIKEYVEIIEYNIAGVIVRNGMLNLKLNYEDPLIKRIIVFEFYYWLMIWDIEKNE